MSSAMAATLSSAIRGAARSRRARARPEPGRRRGRPPSRPAAGPSTVAVVGEKTSECLGSAVSVPAIASGTTSTPSSIASRNAPSRKGASEPSALRVPSGKTTTEAPSSRRRRICSSVGARAVLVAARERDVPGGPHQPTEKRDPEDRDLGEELHLPGQQTQQEDVRHRAVVRDEEVRAARLRRARLLHAEVPERVDPDGERPGAAQHAADAHAVAVSTKGGQPIDRHDGYPDDDDRDVAGPDQIRERQGDRPPVQDSSVRSRQGLTSQIGSRQ